MRVQSATQPCYSKQNYAFRGGVSWMAKLDENVDRVLLGFRTAVNDEPSPAFLSEYFIKGENGADVVMMQLGLHTHDRLFPVESFHAKTVTIEELKAAYLRLQEQFKQSVNKFLGAGKFEDFAKDINERFKGMGMFDFD